MKHEKSLLVELEDAAKKLGCMPSTLGERVGQGGRFHARLIAGARCWPETDAKVRAQLAEMMAGHKADDVQVSS